MNVKLLLVVLFWLISVSSQVGATSIHIPVPESVLDANTFVIDANKPLRLKRTYDSEKSQYINKDKVVDYYYGLNKALSLKNPIVDAKRAFDEGRYFVLHGKEWLIFEFEKSRGELSHFEDFDVWGAMVVTDGDGFPTKKMQGTHWISDWHSSFPIEGHGWDQLTLDRAKKVMSTYGRTVIRYMYYWNRTMIYNLKHRSNDKTNAPLKCTDYGCSPLSP